MHLLERAYLKIGKKETKIFYIIFIFLIYFRYVNVNRLLANKKKIEDK